MPDPATMLRAWRGSGTYQHKGAPPPAVPRPTGADPAKPTHIRLEGWGECSLRTSSRYLPATPEPDARRVRYMGRVDDPRGRVKSRARFVRARAGPAAGPTSRGGGQA